MNSAKQVKGTVLIIDDAISIIDLVKTALTENNYNVLIANSGKSGITSAIKSKPNLILLDILMPDMNGFETCEKLKSSKLTKDIPVLFMSASTETFDKVKAFKTGAVDYLTKPINIEELIARVETHVSLHIMQEKLKNTNQWLEKIVDERTQFLQDKNDEYENLNLELSKKNEKLQNTEKALRDRHEELQATEEELIASNDALKESIEQLYESEQRSTLLSDLNLEGIAIHRNGTILDVNNAFCKISGLSKEETIGFNPIPTMFHPDDLAQVYKNIASKSTKAYTVRGFRKDRTPIWVEMESRNIIYKDEPARTTAIRDVTDKIKQQKALKDSEERYANLLNLSKEGFYNWEISKPMPISLPKNEQILWLIQYAFLAECNDAYAHFSDYKNAQQVIGYNLEQFFRSPDTALNIAEQFVNNNYEWNNHEINFIINNQKKYSLDNLISVNESGYLKFVWGSQIDITNKKKNELDLQKSEKALKSIISNTAGTSSQVFFNQMALSMQVSTEATFSFIGKILDNNAVETIAMASNGKLINNFTYNIKDTPCENVIGQKTCIYSKNISTLFPNDQLLIDMNIEAYIGTPIFNHKNKPIGIIVSLYDRPIIETTLIQSLFEIFGAKIGNEMERLDNEKALIASEEKYRTLIENISQAAGYFKLNGEILLFNKKSAEYLGGKPEAFIGKTVYDIYPLNIATELINRYKQASKSYHTITYEDEMDLLIGKRYLITNYTRILDANGNLAGILSISQDVTDLKKSQKIAEENYIRFKALHNASFGGIAIHDEGLILETNIGLAELTGYTVEELVGMNGLLLINEETRPIVIDKIEHGVYGNPYEAVGIRKDGSTYPVRLEARKIPYKGKMVRVVEFRDLTEQKNVERNIRESEERHRLLFENASLGISYFTPDGKIIAFNKRAAKDLNKTPDFFNGKTLQEAFGIETGNKYQRNIKKSAKTDETIEVEDYINVDNHVKYFNSWLNRIKNADNEIIAVQIISQDNTAKLQLENELKQSEQRFNLAMQAAQEGLFDLNLINNEIYYSPGWKIMLGYEDYELENKFEVWEKLTDAYDLEQANIVFNNHIKGETERYEAEFKMKHKKGHWVHIHAKGTAIRDKNNKAVRVIGTHSDISEHKKLLQNISKQKQLLSQSQSIGHIGSYELDLSNNTLTWSDEVFRIFGYEPKAFTPSYNLFLNNIVPDDKEKVYNTYTNSIKLQQEGYTIEYSIQQKNSNQIKHIKEQCEHIKNTEGKIIRTIGLIQDITKAKEQQAKEHQLKQRIEAGLRSGNLAWWEVETTTGTIAFDDNKATMLGYNPNQFKNLSDFTDLLHYKDYKEFANKVEDAIQNKTNRFVVEYRIKALDGTYKWCRDTATIEQLSTAGKYQIIGITEDITDRKQNQQVLDSFFEQPLNLHLIASFDGTIHKLNKGWQSILGYEPKNLIGKKFMELVHLDDINATQKELEQLSKGKTTFYFENRYRHKNGKYRVMTWSAIANIEEGLIYAIASDATERVKAQNDTKIAIELLQHERDLLHAIMNNLPDTIYFKDNESKFTRINKAQSDFLGINSPSEAIGKSDFDFFKKEHAQVAFNDEQNILKTGKALINKIENPTTKDGKTKWVTSTKVPLFNEKHEVNGMVGITRDITVIKLAEEALRESQGNLSAIIENSDDLILSIDQAYKLKTINSIGIQGFKTIFNTNIEVGNNILDKLPDSTNLTWKNYCDKALDGEAFTIDYHFNENNQDYYANISFNPIREGKNTVGVAIISRNTTESKRVLRIEKAKLRILEFVQTFSFDELLQMFLDEVEKLTQSTIGFYHFVEDDQETINLQTWSTNTLKNMCGIKNNKFQYKLSEAGIWANCIRTKTAIIHNDYLNEKNKKGLPEGHAPVIRELVVPVIRGNKVLAVLGVGNKPTNYNNIDIQTVQHFADLTWETFSRKKTEELILKERNHSANILKGTNAGTWEWDIQSGEIIINERWAEIIGYTLNEFEHTVKAWIASIHPDDFVITNRLMQAHLKGETEYFETEFRQKHKNGSWVWINARASVTKWNIDKKPLIMSGTHLDINDKKNAEQNLKSSENRLQLIFDNSPAIMLLLNANAEIITVNNTALQYTGSKMEDVVNKQGGDFFNCISAINAPNGCGTHKNCEQCFLRKIILETINDNKSIKKVETILYLNKNSKSVPITVLISSALASPAPNPTYLITIDDITERKNAEMKIKANETRFRTIIESANDAIFIANARSGIIIDVNKKGELILGRSRNEIIGMNLNKLSQINKLEDITYDLANDINNHIKPIIKEVNLIHKSGEAIPTELSPALINLDDENEYLVGFYRDIRLRKKAEQELEDSFVKYKTLADYTYDWEYWKSPDEKYIYNSPSCKRITGFSSFDFENNPSLFESLIIDDDKHLWNKHSDDVSNKVTPNAPVEFRIKTKSGKIKWISHVCQPVFDQNNNYIGNRGTNRDISSQKQFELELVDSEKRFKQLANFTQEGIILHDNGVILDVNQSLLNISGYSEEYLIGKNLLTIFIQDKDKPMILEKMKQNNVGYYEINAKAKGNKLIPVEISARAMTRNNKKIRVATIRDITEQKQIQQRILSAIIQTEEEERQRIAQELHDGLGPVLSTVKLYAQTYFNSDNETFKEKIKEQLNIGINDALAQVSTISNNLSPHVLNDFGLKVAIEKFIDKLNKVTNVQFQFNFNIEQELKKDINVTLYRVGIELINNSIKHSGASIIQINMTLWNNIITFTYEDNGKGFDFETIKNSKKGMGLFNIINRVNSLNGSVEHKRLDEGGFKYLIEIPYK